MSDENDENIKEEEKCDPTTMNCDELGNHIINLIDERSGVNDAIKKLDEIRPLIDSDELNKLYDGTLERKEEIDDEIYQVTERAIACRSLKPEDKKEETEEENLTNE